MNRLGISKDQNRGLTTTVSYNKAVEEAEQILALAKKDLNDVRRNRSILCSCSYFHKICDLELIVTHWCTEPHGCTGGDYWLEGEWNFICPDTDVRNRLLFNDYVVDYDQRNRAGVAAEPTFKQIYRHLFKSLKNVYESYPQGDFYNNYFVDSQRELFELPTKTVKSK